jgi:hypothetical protein
MANDLTKLTAAALAMLSSEAMADVSKGLAPDETASKASSFELILSSQNMRGLRPDDLTVSIEGKISIVTRADQVADTDFCNVGCVNCACH